MIRIRWYGWVLAAVAIVLAASIVYMLTASRPLSPREGERRDVRDEVGAEREARPLAPEEGAWVAANCVVEPRGRERSVAARAAGPIAATRVEVGEWVDAGDPLAELEAGAERAGVSAAGAEVARARAELDLLEAGTRPEEIAAARAEAEAARARADLARGVFERLERASAGGGVPEDELARARDEARAARGAADAARAALRQAERGPRDEELARARASLEAARARREEARAELSARTITAPIAGEVLEVAMRAGEHYQPGEALVILGDTRALRARAEVDEGDAAGLRAGAPARARVPGGAYEARVIEIGERVRPKQTMMDDPRERMDVRVLEAVLALPDAKPLVVGQRGVCYIATDRSEARDPPRASSQRWKSP